jgi:SAM-dependent methyltransferase
MLRAMQPAQIQTEGIHDLVKVTKAAGDVLRASILQALNNESFGVLELCKIFDIAQPAMSHHLRILADAGLVSKRKEGTSVFYQRANATPNAFLAALFDAIDESASSAVIQKRIERIYKTRQQYTTEYFRTHADALANQQERICLPVVYTQPVLEIANGLPKKKRVHALEVGPGNGELLYELAQIFNQATGVDNTPEMLENTSSRVQGVSNVTLYQQDFMHLSIPHPEFNKEPNAIPKRFDLIVSAMVLHHQPSPRQFIEKVQHFLQPDGTFVIAELCPHTHNWAKEHCGDLWLGFAQEQLAEWAKSSGLTLTSHQNFAQRNGFTIQILAFKPAATSANH